MEPSTTDQQVSIGEPLVFLEPSAPTYQIGGSSLELGSGGDDSGSSEPPSDGGSYAASTTAPATTTVASSGEHGSGEDEGEDEGEGHGHGDSSHTSLSASLLELVEGCSDACPQCRANATDPSEHHGIDLPTFLLRPERHQRLHRRVRLRASRERRRRPVLHHGVVVGRVDAL